MLSKTVRYQFDSILNVIIRIWNKGPKNVQCDGKSGPAIIDADLRNKTGVRGNGCFEQKNVKTKEEIKEKCALKNFIRVSRS
jgi:hypothetical protein